MTNRRPSSIGILLLAFVAAGCGGSPDRPSTTTVQVQVGVSGNASTTVAPGETRQLFATATNSAGATNDVTNTANWQSSNPALATVSSGGLVTAAAEGSVEISATYQNVRGSLRAEVRKPSCAVTQSPESSKFDAFGGSGTVTVNVSPSDCRWTVQSDAPGWVPLNEPSRTGSGTFAFAVAPNSTTDVRVANLTITSSTGQELFHVVAQDRPLSCSYVTRPESATFTAAGGSGSFDVITTPSDCEWRTNNTLASLGVLVTGGFSGKGNTRVTYIVPAHTRSADIDGYIEILGLSGLNPPGRHHITIQKR